MKLPPGFDLNSIEAFILTAELGGMTQSAQYLGITQSAVSQTIAKLEAALGTSLFDRALRPLALTSSGKTLFDNGSMLIVSAKALIGEIRDGSKLPIESITIAMAESMANQLTSPLLAKMGDRATRWRIKSGISLNQHQDFLSRKFDMLITGSSTLENVEGVEHYPIFDERFILVLPKSYKDPIDPIETIGAMPFIRYSLQSGMGQRIEKQIARMRLRLNNFVEVDSTYQQLTAVANGLGWSITTPICVATHLNLLDNLRLEPMPRGQFYRRIQVVARAGDFGDLPAATAELARSHLRDHTFPELIAKIPWIENEIEWSPERDSVV
jgi:DNA-binding transcriptional LysR family regulator